MNDWSAGYVSDIDYTFGYYTELNPLRMKLAFLYSGLAFPECGTACELGFGQGLSTNIHASASTVQWYGTDFSPSQVTFARSLSQSSENNAKLFDDSFEEFLARTDLPDFDYIGLHGIWSWVSEDNRSLIVEFLRRKLKVGGVVYISYNTLPGWASFAPMRHLLTEHADVLGSEGGGVINRIDGAIDFASKLLASNPAFASANHTVGERITKLQGQDRHYLAHEYFNKDWHPIHFSTMAKSLNPAKLQYACSTHYLDHVDAINLTKEQQEFLNSIPDAIFKESVRDFMVNQQFRRDYWVKGKRSLSVFEKSEQLLALSVVLVAPRDSVSLQFNGPLGQLDMAPQIYSPILDALAEHKPKTINQLQMIVNESNVTLVQLIQAIMVLAGAGHLACTQPENTWVKNKKKTDKLNSIIIEKARASADINHLASPVTGGGLIVTRFNQLFLLALGKGLKHPKQLSIFVCDTIFLVGERVIHNGKVLESKEENLEHLEQLATEFLNVHLPILKALQVI